MVMTSIHARLGYWRGGQLIRQRFAQRFDILRQYR